MLSCFFVDVCDFGNPRRSLCLFRCSVVRPLHETGLTSLENSARNLNISYINFIMLSSPCSILTASVVQWSEFMATDSEVRVRFKALPNFMGSSGCGTGSTQPREYN
jgi:hypothetical protein